MVGTSKPTQRLTAFLIKFIHFLQFDRAGQLWIGTRKGVSQFDPSRGRFRNFSKLGMACSRMT